MKKLFLIFFIFLLTAFTPQNYNLKNINFNNNTPLPYCDTHLAKANFKHFTLSQSASDTEIINLLKNNIFNLQSQFTDIKQIKQIESPVATHYTFQQYYHFLNGKNSTLLPIHSATINVTVQKSNNTIIFINENTYPVNTVPLNEVQNLLNTNSQKVLNKQTLLKNNLLLLSNIQPCIIFISAEKPSIAYKFSAQSTIEDTYYTYFYDNNLKKIHQYDNRHYYKPREQTTAQGYVFLPDPLTSNQVSYGQNGKYKDNNDQDRDELTNSRVLVNLDVKFDGNIYTLENEFLSMALLNGSTGTAPVNSITPLFNFTRSQSGFEDVNTFYHISESCKYLKKLEFNSLVNSKVYVDAHYSTEDNSFHQIVNNKSELHFGTGGIDDAEDADVIIHEFAHAISWNASEFNTGAIEASGIDEGWADYWASSYSRSINEYKWQKVFTWDGNTAAFTGRNVASTKHYPEDNDGSKYSRSEIWSSVLMEIFSDLGREVTDRIVVQSLFSYSQGMSMKTAAQLLLLADELLYHNAHISTLTKYFIKRGLIEYEVYAGQDTTICLGDTLQLAKNMPNLDASISWTPCLTLSSCNTIHPIAQPDLPTYYVLSVIDNETNYIYRDTVFVNVNTCFAPVSPTLSTPKLLNTQHFGSGRGYIYVQVPIGTQKVIATIYNAKGQIVKQQQSLNDQHFAITPEGMTTGVYIINIDADNKKATFKIAKVR